mgnify:CR=1 FL=1
MNFAIIGVGKIGIYHIRDFINHGYILKGIVNSTIESSIEKVKLIKDKYNIQVNIYECIEELYNNENIDLIVITSSTETHLKYINFCLMNNIHFYCEKPFIYNINSDNTYICKDIINKCNKKYLKFNVQTQWVYGIQQIKHLIDTELNDIYLHMEHFKTKEDINFFTENISHMNSIIIYLLGRHPIEKLIYNKSEKYPQIIQFIYNNINITYSLGYPHNKNIIYKFNSTSYTRYASENYDQSFIINNNKDNFIKIKDPFTLCIENFINNTSIITKEDILHNVEMMDNISKYI